ncbi:putative reverse transcriptase domain-containing protein [Tanacetum coccineum]
MPTTRSKMVPEAIKELIAQRIAEGLATHEANRNVENIVESGDENEDGDEGGAIQVARECTFKEFLNCQPLNFKGTEGAVGLAIWFEKMESVFHINGPEEEDKIERMASSLMDQKVRANAGRQADNKRKWENHSRDNHVHQQPYKRTNVARAYIDDSNEKKPYSRNLPYCNKCKLHHAGPCIVKCGNCKKVGHMMRDYKTPTTAIANQRTPLVNQKATVTCYECGRQCHYRRGEANQDPNVITGTFLLNNRYASMLFDTGADRSLVSTTFSSIIDIAPIAQDTKYFVELADGKVIGADTIIRGCTLNFQNHPFDVDLMPIKLGSLDVIIGMD